ncbi:MAG: DUF342 domain-containing protein [Candidatus Hydrogenedentes bacterium]|nr:DUF342 domain-containing protein [Candidatus Hydrogenedentota bacterium]
METDTQQDVQVVVSDDKLQVSVSCMYSEETAEALITEIRQQLTKLDISQESEKVDLPALLRTAAAEDPEIDSLLIYEGIRPIKPIDGYIDWCGDYFKEGFVTDEKTGAMDFRRATAQASVLEGEMLATIVAPVEGKPGKDVRDTTLKVMKGKPALLRAAQGVEQREDGAFYAKVNGRVRRDNKTVSVDDVLTITGDVGLKTGHISHPGALVVEGDITEGSEVDTKGDIEVHGIIELANVKCGGDLTVHSGIVGSDDTTIRVNGNVFVHYILEANMEVSGDVTVEREIMNSTITCRGAVLASSARIVGGEVRAAKEIQAGDIGSDASVRTTMILGEDPLREKKLRKQRGMLEDLLDDREKIDAAIHPHIGKEDSLSPGRKSVLELLLQKLSETKEEISDLKESIKTLEEESVSREKLTMLVVKQAYPETVFTMRKESHILRHSVAGPVKVTFLKGKIKFICNTNTYSRDGQGPAEQDGLVPNIIGPSSTSTVKSVHAAVAVYAPAAPV